jgi:sphingosine kinase
MDFLAIVTSHGLGHWVFGSSPPKSESEEQEAQRAQASQSCLMDSGDAWEEEEDSYEPEPCPCLEQFEKANKFPASFGPPYCAQKAHLRKVALIYNPKSGSHRGKKIAVRTEELLKQNNVQFTSYPTEKKNHAEEICRTIPLQGVDMICLIGGDGTIHEAINGLMKRKDRQGGRVPLGIIPAGTGNSFCLELYGSTKVSRALKHVFRGLNCPIDISEVQFINDNDREETIYSFNSLHWGLGSRVNVTAEKLRWMGKAVRYTTAALLELTRGRKERLIITMKEKDGNVIKYDENFSLLIANNIITAAKGMKMAPNAKLNDGLMDVLLFRSSNTFDLLETFRKVYDGTHTDLPFVEYRQVSSFSISPIKKKNSKSETQQELEIVDEIVDIDGELSGHTPFTCTVIPRAIRVVI